jgi:uncharacterized cupin superfamily protein
VGVAASGNLHRMKKINVDETGFEWDSDDPEGFKSGRKAFRQLLGAAKTGISLYELPPGQAICPYHYEYAEEEWLVVLKGEPTLRTPEGSSRLRPWDVCVFPTGPDGAHGVRNETDEVVHVMMFSDVMWPAATVYPDSDKIAVWTGPGGDSGMFQRDSTVDYFEGET